MTTKKHTVKLTIVQIITLSKAVQTTCWAIPIKGFGRVRQKHALRAEQILLRAIS